jgi:hypothetical protein
MAADRQLCSVTGPSPVVMAHDGLPLFDADGSPVTLERDICLDCIVTVVALPPNAGTLTPPCAIRASDLTPAPSDWMLTGACPGGLARAPPPMA